MTPIQSFDSSPQSGRPIRVFARFVMFIGLMVENIPNQSNKLGVHTSMLVALPRSGGHRQKRGFHAPDMISLLAAIA